jgi:hypothetical protein
MITNNGLQLSLYRTTQIQHLKFAFVRSHRGSKKKVIEKISTVISHLSPLLYNYSGEPNRITLSNEFA